jgi:hypothetical protein
MWPFVPWARVQTGAETETMRDRSGAEETQTRPIEDRGSKQDIRGDEALDRPRDVAQDLVQTTKGSQPMKRIAIAAAIAALASPAFAGNLGTNADLAADLGRYGFWNDGPSVSINTNCGQLGLSSLGGCRAGIFGLIDANQHGTCWLDRRSGRPTCER